MGKRGLTIHLKYESGRLSEKYIAEAYQKLVQIIKKPINSNKEKIGFKKTKIDQYLKGHFK
jgi:hypothetical protein